VLEYNDAILVVVLVANDGGRRAAKQPRQLRPSLAERGSRRDPGISLGSIMTAAREQLHRLADAARDQSIAVVLDFVHPVGAPMAAWPPASGCMAE
jgi:hypothetical protein